MFFTDANDVFPLADTIIPDIFIFGAAAAVCAVIYLILNGILHEKSRRAKGIAFSIVSLVYAIIFIFAFIFDKLAQLKNPDRYYFYFVGVAIIYFLVFALPLLLTSKKTFYGVKGSNKMVYTYKPKEEHVYIVFKYNNYLYLRKDTNTGIDVKIGKNQFSDDIINYCIKKYNIDYLGEFEKNGIVTIEQEKKEQVYNCYLFEINEELFTGEFEKKYIYELGEITIPDLDKYIILNCMTGEYFDKKY